MSSVQKPFSQPNKESSVWGLIQRILMSAAILRSLFSALYSIHKAYVAIYNSHHVLAVIFFFFNQVSPLKLPFCYWAWYLAASSENWHPLCDTGSTETLRHCKWDSILLQEKLKQEQCSSSRWNRKFKYWMAHLKTVFFSRRISQTLLKALLDTSISAEAS